MQNREHIGKFNIPITILPQDIDGMKHVNNVVYLRWVQEVATAHWKAIAPEEIQHKYAWVVLRHEIDYFSSALLGDQLTGYTWVGEVSGPRFTRFVEICHTTGKTLAKATTIWCLLDAQTMRPKRIESDIIHLLDKAS